MAAIYEINSIAGKWGLSNELRWFAIVIFAIMETVAGSIIRAAGSTLAVLELGRFARQLQLRTGCESPTQ